MSVWLRRGWLVLLLGLTACGAAPTLNPAIGIDSPAQVNVKLGLSYLQHGNYPVAEAKLNKALLQNPKLGEAHHYLAELYRRTDRQEQAKASYRRALKYIKNDMDLQNNYGVFLCDRGDYAEAVRALVKVASSRSYNRPDLAYVNAALCALRIPDEVAAEKYLRLALAINKNLANALFHMAELSFKQQKFMSARAFGQRYAAVGQPTPQSLLLGVRVELKLGDREAVAEYAQQLSADFPDADELDELDGLLAPTERR